MELLKYLFPEGSGRRRALGLSAVQLFSVLTAIQPPMNDRDWVKAPVQVQLVRDQDGISYLTGGFSLDTPPSLIWEVLTDYERIDDFVESLEASWQESREENRVRVGQEGSLAFLFFRKSISLMLEIREFPQARIQFEDVSNQDFEVYVGGWEIIPELGLTHVLYRLAAKPKFITPPLVSGSLIKKNVASLLREVRAEIMRRAAEDEAEPG